MCFHGRRYFFRVHLSRSCVFFLGFLGWSGFVPSSAPATHITQGMLCFVCCWAVVVGMYQPVRSPLFFCTSVCLLLDGHLSVSSAYGCLFGIWVYGVVQLMVQFVRGV